MEDMTGEELLENPVILSVTSLICQWVVLGYIGIDVGHESGRRRDLLY